MATIKDVAKQSGVSIATVSRVINGSVKVKPETREAVLRTIKELNYTPNAIAQGLQKKKTNTIGVLFPDATSYYFAEIIRGINNYVRQNGYQIVVSSSHDAIDEAETFQTLLKSSQVSGMILMMPSIHNKQILNSNIKDIPTILLNTNIDTPESVTIVIDNYTGAKEATAHLISHGHRKIGFIHGAPNNFDSQERYRGYLDALRDGKLQPDKRYEFHGDFTENSGFIGGMELFGSENRPTAIFVANDAMAIGVIEAARRMSLKVPDDVAIIGFDDIPTGKYIYPPLSTVNVPTRKVGEIAGAQIVKMLTTPEKSIKNKRITIPVSLQLRESCGCQIIE